MAEPPKARRAARRPGSIGFAGELGIVIGQLEAIKDRLDRADLSRAGLHGRLDDIALRTAHLETDVLAIKNRTADMQTITDDVVKLRERAIGAGTLGRWLLVAGGWIVGAASGAAAAYTWLTGRPPP